MQELKKEGLYPDMLNHLGWDGWNPMQEASFDAILHHPEVLILAPTGTGKTVAFLVPLWKELKKEVSQVQAIVLVPSRELALQTEQVWKKMGTGLKSSCCYGGHPMSTEIQNLSNPPALLIGTPGRISDHLDRGTFFADRVRMLVLDEFDKSLSLGFEEEMSFIIGKLHQVEKRILVSATPAVTIPEFSRITHPFLIDYTSSEQENPEFEMILIPSMEKDKSRSLCQLQGYIGPESSLVFCNHREAVERTSQILSFAGIENEIFHGGLQQMEREQALTRFRNGSTFVLVATDLASRGLDIPKVKHVIHYHLPHTREEFIHRNGRTNRMHATGKIYLILHPEEKLPQYLQSPPVTLNLPDNPLPPPISEWTTLFINGGKKDKLNKVDIVGFLAKKGHLAKSEIGLIEVKDFISFAAVKKNKVHQLLSLISQEKLKGKKYKIAVTR
ncbi:MAG: DEAD/DEAH box helicase [Chitinophagaceae bacterium]